MVERTTAPIHPTQTAAHPHGLPAGYSMRPLTFEDVPVAAALFNACYREETGASLVTEQEFWDDVNTPGFNIATDSALVFAPDGTLAAYGELWNVNKPPVRSMAWARVHPEYRARGLGSALTRWAEARARQFIPLMPDHVRVILTTSANANQPAAHTLLRDLGFSQVRSFYRMRIEMETPPPQPVWPEGIRVRTSHGTRDDFVALYDANMEAFRDHWGYMPLPLDIWLHRAEQPGFDPSLWFAAEEDDAIAGVCLCHVSTSDDTPHGVVQYLAVRRPWRRRGLGLSLLQHAFGELWQRGQHTVELGVDAESLTGATRLYEKAGMHVAQHYLTFEKELRLGEDLRTMSLEA
jgi:mycothiol synthase